MDGRGLDWSRAEVMSAAEARVPLGADTRSVHIPDLPPDDNRAPNGLHLYVNLKTGRCKFPPMR